MAFRDVDAPKLALAEGFRESAEHSSEPAMRNSISRMYYANMHVAEALTGVSGHGKLPAALNEIEPGLGDDFKRLRELRANADYVPNFVKSEFRDIDGFRARFPEIMNAARTLYERMLNIGSASS